MSDLTSDPSAKERPPKRRPVAWLHTLHYERGNGSRKLLSFTKTSPFGVPGRHHSVEYKVTSEALYRG